MTEPALNCHYSIIFLSEWNYWGRFFFNNTCKNLLSCTLNICAFYVFFKSVINFIHISVYMSIPITQISTPPSPPHRGFPPLVSIRLFSTSVSQLRGRYFEEMKKAGIFQSVKWFWNVKNFFGLSSIELCHLPVFLNYETMNI